MPGILHLVGTAPCEVDAIMPHLQVRKVRLREAK